MTNPFNAQELQELTAGYVLGDLTSEEAAQFHQLLVQHPELREEVEALQEALAMMPYALPEEKPQGELRSRILQATQAEFEQTLAPPASSSTVTQLTTQQPAQRSHGRLTQRPQRQRFMRWQRPWVLGSIAAGVATIFIAVGNWQPASNFIARTLPTLSRPAGEDADNLNQSPTVQTAEVAQDVSEMEKVWAGFEQLLQDHHNSVTNPEGPVDFVVQRADDVVTQLEGFQTSVAALPTLPDYQGELLGGSDCQFDDTRGLRLSYRVKGFPEASQVVSIYQLDLNGDQFPQFHSSYMTLRQPDGTGVVLWREESYLYALVADLPMTDLNNLAHEISQI